MIENSKLSHYKIKKIIQCFCIDIPASKTALLLNLNRNTINYWYMIFREAIYDYQFGLLPSWAKELKFSSHTYNARTETVGDKPSFRHAWKYSKFCLVPVQEFYEPKYINGKPHWYTIKRKDDQPFTVAGIYDDAVINGNKVRSFSMLTINSDHHPFMKQFHAPKDEKRSIIVIPEQYRKDWLTADHEHAHEYFFQMPDEFVTFPRDEQKQNVLF